MPWARAVQAVSPILLTASLEAKNRAQIQNAANSSDDGDEHVAPRAVALRCVVGRRRRRRGRRRHDERLLGRRPVAHRQLQGGAAEPDDAGEHEPDPAVPRRPVEADGVVEAPLAGTDRGDGPGDDADRRAVLPAVLEHEEPAVGVAGDEHHADHPGRRQRGQQAEGEQQPGADLGRRGQPGLDVRPAHADRLEPPGRAGELPAAPHLVVAVEGEEHPEHDPQGEQREIGLVHARTLPSRRSPPPDPPRRSVPGSSR